MDNRAHRALPSAQPFMTTRPATVARHALSLLTACLMATSAFAADTNEMSGYGTSSNDVSGPVRLNGNGNNTPNSGNQSSRNAGDNQSNTDSRLNEQRQAQLRYIPGEFEIYVNRLLGIDLVELRDLNANSAYNSSANNGNNTGDRLSANSTSALNRNLALDGSVRRLGADLMLNGGSNPYQQDADGPRQAPADYLIGIGDEIQVTVWGSADADLRLTVDRSGRITIPRVGPVLVSGIRYGDLNDVVRTRIGQVFRNFQVSTSLGKLRNIRIYVTGFTQKPGAYTVSSLATIVNALTRVGGPSAAGSYRQIELRRNGQVVSQFDAYDLLLKGDKSTDRPLQAEDVIHIGPIGPQVAILGSVNKQTIAELKPGETVADVLAMAGGLSAVADRTRVSVERLSDRNDRRVVELQLPEQMKAGIGNGDVLRVFSGVDAALPQHKQYKRVVVEGEVARPGEYVMPPTSTLADAIQTAGGLTPQAYVYGTDFVRESVRLAQQQNYDRALRDMETEFTKNSATARASNADEAAALAQRASGTERLVQRLRAVRPTGRVVLQVESNARQLPSLVVEDGDRLMIPARPATVGVFGSVFNAGSFLLADGTSVDDVVKLAGGPTRGADSGSIFVIRANGTVISTRQSSGGWLGFGSSLSGLQALPGDTVFVPEEMNKTTFIQDAKDWTQILANFGLGVAALKTIRD